MTATSFRSLGGLLTIFLLPAFSVLAQDMSLKGLVVDTEGAVVSGAHVFVRTDVSGGVTQPSTDRFLRTDRQGRFEVSMSGGFYDVCVMADAFTPECRKVLLGVSSKQARFRLRVDPIVTSKLGDEVIR